MGNMGGIERLMVFGILIIIVTILGIAFFSASKIEDPFIEEETDEASTDSYYREDIPATVEELAESGGDLAGGPDEEAVNLGQTPLKLNANVDTSQGTEPPPDGVGTPGDPQETPATNESLPEVSNTVPEKPAFPETYVILQGDSFAKIARKIFGDEKWTDKIVKANPGLDPLDLKVGMKIKLPKIEEESRDSGGSRDDLIKMRTEAKTYIVKENDTLVKIAERTYGSKRAWKKIYEANRDILLDPDSLIPGMELRLP